MPGLHVRLTTTPHTRRWRPFRGATSIGVMLAFLLALTACGSDRPDASSPLPAPSAGTADSATYDLVVIGSAENNPLFSDLYGVTLNPLRVYRITTDKRVSAVDADTGQIVVAAADGPTDRLGIVTAAGDVMPIPGLGRPFAYTPSLMQDGSILYRDFIESGEEKTYRVRTWNPAAQKSATLFTSTRALYGLQPLPGGKFAQLQNNLTGDDAIVVRDTTGKQRTYPIPGDGGFVVSGKTQVATTLNAADSKFGTKPTGLALLDVGTGKVTKIDGWQPIAWTVDGTKLLVRSTDDLTNSVLAILDPENTGQPQPVGTLPNLAIYTGSWIR
jgi:hypothetical protein